MRWFQALGFCLVVVFAFVLGWISHEALIDTQQPVYHSNLEHEHELSAVVLNNITTAAAPQHGEEGLVKRSSEDTTQGDTPSAKSSKKVVSQISLPTTGEKTHRPYLKMSDWCHDRAKEVLDHQRGGWGTLDRYDMYDGALSAFKSSIEPFLPTQTPQKVLEIGCGMAMYDLFLFKHYNWDANIELFLLDKSEYVPPKDGNKSNMGGFHANGAESFVFYNNLQCAKDILVANGVSDNKVHALEANETILEGLESGSFDLVYSVLSWGHHYPVSTYISNVKRILKPGGRLMMDLRGKPGYSIKKEYKGLDCCNGDQELAQAGFDCKVANRRRRGATVICSVKTKSKSSAVAVAALNGVSKENMRPMLNMSDYCIDRAKEVLRHQRGGWGNYDRYDLYAGALSAFQTSVEPFLPTEVPQKVLEIGCGMAMYDLFLFKHYNWNPKIELYLLDKSEYVAPKSEQDKKGFQGFHKDGVETFVFYNNLQCAKDILVANGINHNNVHALEANSTIFDGLETDSFDFIYSVLSWGHHYPVSTYISDVKRVLKPGGRLMMDLRAKATYSIKNKYTGLDCCNGGKELKDAGFDCRVENMRRRGATVVCSR
eukprot:CAMPEP_0196585146 /NCGR_PEP_ID=MMETSP1081-20130531/49673_1 /TAXON_ID=36882 /ORGANISM="Pyramimonas amylifera, Strain CCMP720" /LENGTH=599 /DNA_ID=CAMNT_0041906603 /DNA_START=366 /DNA_END=2165 /DNA_ORIENTATION=+